MLKNTQFALKIDVDTERGTRVGVPQLQALLSELKIPATFFFSFGPDNTGRALKRIFRRGFLSKVKRTNVAGVYGLKTLLNGVLWPGPHIANKHSAIMRQVRAAGFSVGIHCYDHIKWQDGVAKMAPAAIAAEFNKARQEFTKVFGTLALAAAAPGWQANAKTLQVYDDAKLLYASDARGTAPFYPRVGQKVFRTLQIPTTLPTLDELVGRPEFPLTGLTEHYLSLLTADALNVMTIHAELEGMHYLEWFRRFLETLQEKGVAFVDLEERAKYYLQNMRNIPVADLLQGEVMGRSGFLALQAEERVNYG